MKKLAMVALLGAFAVAACDSTPADDTATTDAAATTATVEGGADTTTVVPGPTATDSSPGRTSNHGSAPANHGFASDGAGWRSYASSRPCTRSLSRRHQ